MLPDISGEFRMVADPELRFAQSGKAVAKGRIVASSRKKDPESGEWKDDKNTWLNVSCFGKMAENFVESIEKGDLIFVSGRLEQDDWETKDGEKRTSFGIIANTIGPALNFNAARPIKDQAKREEKKAPAQDDPWRTPEGGDEDPPF